MAGDHDGDAVPAVRRADRAGGLGAAQLSGECRVAARGAVPKGAERGPHGALEFGALGTQRQIERSPRPLEVRVELGSSAIEDALVFARRAVFCRTDGCARGLIREEDLGDRTFGGAEGEGTERGGVVGDHREARWWGVFGVGLVVLFGGVFFGGVFFGGVFFGGVFLGVFFFGGANERHRWSTA